MARRSILGRKEFVPPIQAVDEHVHGGPVRRLAGQPVATLKQQNALTRGGEVTGERAAARPGSDHDNVETSVHAVLLPRLGARPGALAANGPANPPPMITMRQ